MNFFDRLFKKVTPEKTTPVEGLELKKWMVELTGKSENITVLEAGACGGEDTLQWASIPEVSEVFAFEPVKNSYDALVNKSQASSKVRPFFMALSDHFGETEIHLSTNSNNPEGLSSSSSILQPTGHTDFHKHITFNDVQKVKLITIDQWAKENNVDQVDIMWLDMQGAEYLALKGGESILKSTSVIFSEVSLKEMYANSILYPEFKKLLENLGFAVEKEFLFWEDMGNVLFKRRK